MHPPVIIATAAISLQLGRLFLRRTTPRKSVTNGVHRFMREYIGMFMLVRAVSAST